MKKLSILVIIAIMISIVACNSAKNLTGQALEIHNYKKDHKLKGDSLPSGLYYIETQAGTGDFPQKGNTVTVHYTGTLLDGTKFDSSYDRNDPFKFVLGAGRVIKGWDEGIALMKKGGKATLIIPPRLGYGSREIPGVIPANSVLIFEVELIDFE